MRNEQKTTKNFFLFTFILLFAVSGAYAADNITYGTILSYDMENLPDSYLEDGTGNGYQNNLTDGLAMGSVSSKIENWALTVSNTDYTTIADINNLTDVQDSAFQRSESFWVYPDEDDNGTWYTLYGYGEGSSVGVYITNTNALRVAYYGSTTCTNGKYTHTTIDNAINVGEWNHVVLDHKYTASGIYRLYTYINGVNKTTTTGATSGSWASGSTAYLKLGKPITSGASCDFGYLTTNSTSRIDQFMMYNRSLTWGEITELYNAGAGVNPFSTEIPYQVASMPNVNLNFGTYQTTDYGAYFNYESYMELAFDYDNASQSLSYVGVDTYTNDDFAIAFNDATTITFWSYNNAVPSVNMSIRACNNNGCSDYYTPLVLSVDYDGDGIVSLATINNFDMNKLETKFVLVSQYFSDFDNLYIQFTNPDTFVVTNVSESVPNNNSCMYIGITEQYAVYVSNNDSCTVSNIYYIVDDDTSVAVSNPFAITVTGEAPSENGTAAGGLGSSVNFVNALFPEYDTIDFKTRMVYVIVFMGATLLLGVALIFGANNQYRVLFGASIGGLMLIEFIFFTAIKYIPIIWVILLSLGVVVLGIGMFRSKTVGDG